MRKMKFASLALVFALGLVLLAGNALAADTVIDRTYYEVVCPDGWKDESKSGNIANLSKVGKSSAVLISTGSESLSIPDGAKVVSYEINGVTWKGFTQGGQDSYELMAEGLSRRADNTNYTVQTYMCSPEDADVKAIIASIKVKD